MSSLSASAENLTNNSETQSNDSSSMCLELALEGERLCKSGDCRAGVAFFQAAIQAGTDDLRTLSAIYSQLGNAYFYLGDYTKAMQYHKLDLTLARSMDDKIGEAKSSGNLGNALKVMGRFDEAAICCDRHLILARQLGDRLSEGRALYNLGNVYHAKGKHLGGQSDPGDSSEDVKDALMKAVDYYLLNLALMKDLGDRGAQGRACGNLGNTYYLLGEFGSAIENHEERLRIAKEFGDKAAERRANSNLGNSHIFLGQFEQAAEHYKRTLSLAVELGERAVEAQACYSLGNTYTLLRNFQMAIDYHQRHLAIAQELGDRVGEARACWSLGNAHSSIENHEKGLFYAQSHFNLAKELGDSVGEATARMNISDLRKILGFENSLSSTVETTTIEKDSSELTDNQTSNDDGISRTDSISSTNSRHFRVRRQSMEQLDLIKLTPDGKRIPETTATVQTNDIPINENQQFVNSNKVNEDDFFNLLTRSQSKRMDDQRCSLKIMSNNTNNINNTNNSNNHNKEIKLRKPLVQQNSIAGSTVGISGVSGIGSGAVPKENRHALLEMIADLQSERMDEQRAVLPGLRRSTGVSNSTAANNNNNNNNNNNVNNNNNNNNNNSNNNSNTNNSNSNVQQTPAPDDAFLDMLMRCQGARIEEQRSELPRPNITMDAEYGESNRRGGSGATVPDEDFFSLIMRVQGGRMEDQRAAVPFQTSRSYNNMSSALNRNNKNSKSSGGLSKKSK